MKWAELAAGRHIAGRPERIMLDTRTEPTIPAECYPFVIAWRSMETGRELESIEVEAPGFVNVPGPGWWSEPVAVCIDYANGDWEQVNP